MISNHLSLVEQQRQHADPISEQTAQFQASGGAIAQLPSPPRNPLPPKRSAKIDPETILKRRKPPIRRAERRRRYEQAQAAQPQGAHCPLVPLAVDHQPRGDAGDGGEYRKSVEIAPQAPVPGRASD
ncbi:hypothetical protein [Pseudomonas sp. MPB23]|uniref:hypothetical protein n=1 Tax=Pseudomonas sp. MPB23 TaxID=3388490 RepID=UPI0039851157